MSRRIVLGCYEIPGWGGAATVSYLLFERMQREGLDVAYVNLVSEADEVFLRYVFGDNFGNPRALENVYTCTLKDPLWRAHSGLADLIGALAPDLLFGFGFIAARLLKLAAPGKPLVFMTSGSRQVKHLVETRAIKDFMAFERSVRRGIVFPLQNDQERRAVEACDLLIIHSPLVRFAFDHFFPTQSGKIYSNLISVADFIYPEAEHFQELKRPFAQRDIDVIFIASSWTRPEKNYGLVKKLVSGCQGLSMHIVGSVEQPQLAAQYHGVMTRREDLYDLLGRSKTLVCPSLLDPAPGVLFEASAMGCNVIASPNCGNWQLCHEQLLADRCSPDAFLQRIRLSLTGPYKDNHENFRGGYKDLVDTLGVF
ncbi:MAG: glycosyltransferase [Deltaproteobacteria bacterium]|nr:glycosyltransferase [Deltaproteobacteria bacterium]